MNIKVCKYDVETLLFCETALQQFVLWKSYTNKCELNLNMSMEIKH